MTLDSLSCLEPERGIVVPRIKITPTVLFVIASALLLGAAATNAALGHWLSQSNRDLWQHMAALRSLIADVQHPSNPFVNTDEPSRHFHPYWVIMAVIARAFSLSPFEAMAVASFVSVITLAVGYYSFGRAYFQSEWGPLALLLSSLLAWSFPLSHTGLINIPTLVEGAGYPAVLLVGLSLVLWALVIHSLKEPKIALAIIPLAAFMFATHQLGAGLGFIVAGPLALLFPGGSFARRTLIVSAIVAGVLLSTAWIFFDPITMVLRAGNPTWRHGLPFYTWPYLVALFVPSGFGLLGLVQTKYGGPYRPLLLALLVLLGGFIAGWYGFLVGTRFAPMAVLVLQIGLASLLVSLFEHPQKFSDRVKLSVAGVALTVLSFQGLLLAFHQYPSEYRDEHRYGSALAASEAISANIPDSTEVAAYDDAAWPLVAAGQKVHSIPWPEPLIHDLPKRQQDVERLFDTRLTGSQRVSLAKSLRIKTLILDQRYGPGDNPREWRTAQIRTFALQSKRTTRVGPLWRFDLY